ncbi:hypothetical protein [Brucella haematophila]|uniref:hypothetical protein n=1 Tax=Brucella haematophila TaxID=419474 RepID=UPI00110D71AA|nr:hypothetical protein [Brucella haematophila]TMU84151.1 hypothetical protein FGI60_26160 [Brucella haematophila]
MKIVRSKTITVTIYIAGDYVEAFNVCQEWCDRVGACVTVEPLNYAYTNGFEAGVRVGFINYPRFPADEEYIVGRATELALLLLDRLNQQSFSIVAPTETHWYSRRPDASHPSGGDRHGE